MRTLSTFLGIGGAATLAYIAISSLLVRAGFTPWVVSFVCYAAFIPIVYAAQRKFTFRSSASHSSSFPRYVATQMLGLGMAGALPYALSGVMPPYLSFVAVAFFVAAANFVILKFWAFG